LSKFYPFKIDLIKGKIFVQNVEFLIFKIAIFSTFLGLKKVSPFVIVK